MAIIQVLLIGGSTSTMLEALHVVGDGNDGRRPSLEASNMHFIKIGHVISYISAYQLAWLQIPI